MRKNALIIFARNPVLGKVKTRIASTAGEEAALSIYQQLLRHTHDVVMDVAADKFVFYSDHIRLNDLWDHESFHKFLQSGDTLGEKMNLAFERSFNKGYEKICTIGSDCYELTKEIIEEAFDKLSDNNMVVGPATDGGYYLLGMQQLYPAVFALSNWSTHTVLGETLEIIHSLQLSYSLLPVLSDIDTEADWNKHQLNHSK
jgi:uncharacterized protein